MSAAIDHSAFCTIYIAASDCFHVVSLHYSSSHRNVSRIFRACHCHSKNMIPDSLFFPSDSVTEIFLCSLFFHLLLCVSLLSKHAICCNCVNWPLVLFPCDLMKKLRLLPLYGVNQKVCMCAHVSESLCICACIRSL